MTDLPEGDPRPTPVLAFLDIEASSLEDGSFPIEVGVSLVTPAGIETDSILIKPADHWDLSIWSEQSQDLHGISLENLRQNGKTPGQAAEWVRQRIQGRPTATDAPEFDQVWLDMLMAAGGCPGNFPLIDYDGLVAHFGRKALHKTYLELEKLPAPHRAGPDAKRLATAFALGTSFAPAPEDQ